MLHRTIVLVLLVTAMALCMASEAHAWGAVHAGYTRVGYGGVQHVGYTAARGPYGGVYGGANYGAYGAYGGYRAGYGAYGVGGVYSGYSAYTPAYGGGYAVGGYGGAYAYPGVYRAY